MTFTPEAFVTKTDCTGAVLQPGATCGVYLQFRPGMLGPRVATLTATANVISHDTSLRAIGLGAAVEWWLNPLEFGNAVVANQTPAQDTSLRNIGNAPLAVTSIEIIEHAADFVITELTPGITHLSPNGELAFRIRFRPTGTGDRRAYLRIHTDSPTSPHVLSLAGVGFNAR